MATKQTRMRTAPAPLPQIPGWAVPVTYAVVTLLLFGSFLFGSVAMLGQDSIALSYFARNFYTEFVQQFQRMPYWNPLLFGGLPFVEGMHGDIFYPPSLAMFFMDARTMWGWKMALHIFLGGCFMYLWLRRGLRLSRLPAFFGGLVFMMGAELVSLVLPGGDGKLFVSVLTPLVFWLAERALQRRRLADFAVFALGIALIVFTSHMQAAYYCVWGVSLYFLFRAWQVWKAESGATAARLVGLFAVAGVLGVGAAAVQFLPPLQYLREYSQRVDKAAERGYEWSSTYSLNAEEVMSLAVPEFVGEVPMTYWGKNPLKLNHEYAGLVPLLLIAVLLRRRRTAEVWFFVSLLVLSLLYALASSTPFGRLFYLIPGVTLFRAWSIIIFLYAFAAVTLAAIALQHMMEWVHSRRSEALPAARTLWVIAGLFGLFAILSTAGVFTGAWVQLFYRDIDPRAQAALAANLPMITRGFWIATVLAATVAGLWHLARTGVVGGRGLALLLAAVAALDLYRVDRPFLEMTERVNQQVAASTLFHPDEAILQLQRMRDAGEVFRVVDLGALLGGSPYNNNDFAIHGLEQTAGHHGNEMGRYAALIGGEALTRLDENLRLLDVTNTVYAVAPGPVTHPALEVAWQGQRSAILRKRGALPRAYVAGAVEVVAEGAAPVRLLEPGFDAANTVLVEQPLPEGAVMPGEPGAVQWLERGADRQVLRVERAQPGMLVVLDNWFPAWRAMVDGAEVEVHRVNHTFRGVLLPAGAHTVEFRFEPTFLRTGAAISLAVLALLFAVIGVDGWRRWREVQTARDSATTAATTRNA